MQTNDFDPELVKKAKELTAGPLGQEMTKFPLRFAKPIFFGQAPNEKAYSYLNNGTVSLIDLGNGPIAITCFHVLSSYKKLNHDDPATIFQIGNLKIDPLPNIIDENEKLDMVTLSLNEGQIKELQSGAEIGSLVFRPSIWPPNEIKEGDFIAFGGFPGQWKHRLSQKEFSFGTYSSGGCQVVSVADDHFVCQFERDYWIKTLGIEGNENLRDLGGLSGGPVFILRQLHWEFVGIIYEFSEAFELMFIRPARYINSTGMINH